MRTVARMDLGGTRLTKIQSAKQNSKREKAIVRAVVGDEKFVFDRGMLVEYELLLPEFAEEAA